MSAKIIDGKKLATLIAHEAAQERATLGITPGLVAVLVGDDPASHLYVSLKEKACRDAGIAFEKMLFRADASLETVLRAIANLNSREDIDAILVQLPLPAPLNAERVISAIDPAKDVDGFHPENVAALRAGTPRIIPGLAAGIIALIRSTGEPLAEKSALVVANSAAFFAPLASVLEGAGCKPSFTDADAPGLTELVRSADILIVAVGRPAIINGAMLKPGAIVIDVGTNRVNGKTIGDVDYSSAVDVAGHLTPVPGGVGPMTIALLLKNTVALCRNRRGTK